VGGLQGRKVSTLSVNFGEKGVERRPTWCRFEFNNGRGFVSLQSRRGAAPKLGLPRSVVRVGEGLKRLKVLKGAILLAWLPLWFAAEQPSRADIRVKSWSQLLSGSGRLSWWQNAIAYDNPFAIPQPGTRVETYGLPNETFIRIRLLCSFFSRLLFRFTRRSLLRLLYKLSAWLRGLLGVYHAGLPSECAQRRPYCLRGSL
jgi:hypothetical protein